MTRIALIIGSLSRPSLNRSVAEHIVSQNKKDTRQQAADSTGSTARRSNAVYFLFWLTISPHKRRTA